MADDALHVEDLALATKVAAGDADAIREFVQTYEPVIQRVVHGVRGADPNAADISQQVMARLIAQRAIEGYQGRSSLAVWLRVIAVREAVLMVRRNPHVAADDDQIAAILTPEHDPELAYMKRHYRDVFKAAFRDAIGALDREHRTLLRQSVVDGLGIDKLAALYKIHRATAARRLDAAREALTETTRRLLGERLRVDAGELDSILRLIESHLEITLGPLAPRRAR